MSRRHWSPCVRPLLANLLGCSLLFAAAIPTIPTIRPAMAAAPSSLLSGGSDPGGSAVALSSGLVRDRDYETRIDVNNLNMVVTNVGSFAYDVQAGSAGLEFPNGFGLTTVFASGLWLGAQVFGEDAPRVTVAEYSFEYSGGPLASDGSWDENWTNDSSYRVYKLSYLDGPGTPDWDEWPVDQGAPTRKDGSPKIFGDQTCWTVFHDADSAQHSNDAGGTAPLGVEVQQTVFAVDRTGGDGHVVFVEWTLINKGNDVLDDMYFATWCDPDVGGAGDDLVGCSVDDDMGYAFNATNVDQQYGQRPPAVGIQLIQGPIVPSPGDVARVGTRTIPDYRNLPMTAFRRFISGTDPHSSAESYNAMKGLEFDGTPIIDEVTLEETTFEYSGDPVLVTGWLDSNPADRRMLLSSGPFQMAPGDTQSVVVAVVAARASDRLGSVTLLKNYADDADLLYPTLIGTTGACCVDGEDCVILSDGTCSGTFYPDMPCEPGLCPEMAACCFPDGTCELTEEEGCTGTFFDGYACEPNLCGELGACCLVNGDCVVSRQVECGDTGFVPGVTCDPNPCPPVGACCLPDGDCIIRSFDNCSGTFFGRDTECGPEICDGLTTGACCTPEGCQLVFYNSCDGDWQGAGSVCETGACGGVIWDWTPEDRWLTWVDWGGTFFNGGMGFGSEFFGSELKEEEITSVRIHFTDVEDDWSLCQTYRRDQDYELGGIGTFPGSAWDISDPDNPRRLNINFVEDAAERPADLMWNPSEAPVGDREYLFIMKSDYDAGLSYGDGKTLPDGRLSDVMYAGWTRVRGGYTFLDPVPAEWSFYLQVPGDLYGACCLSDGSCEFVRSSECEGVFQGGGSLCGDCASDFGACCFGDGACEVLAAEDCLADYLGPDTTCDPNPCGQPGACCTSTGRCIIVDRLACIDVYQGDVSSCNPNPCDPPGAAGVDKTKAVMLVETNPSIGDVVFDLWSPGVGQAEVDIFDISGRRVWSWRQSVESGWYEVAWDAVDEEGRKLPRGSYFARLRTPSELNGRTEALRRITILGTR